MVLDLLGRERLAWSGARPRRAAPMVKLESPMCRDRPSRFTCVEGADAVGQRDLGVGPVEQQQVDLGRRASFARLSSTERCRSPSAIAVGPHLGGDEDALARHAGGREALADDLLVGVALGRVDMGVARRSAAATISAQCSPRSCQVPSPIFGMIAPAARTARLSDVHSSTGVHLCRFACRPLPAASRGRERFRRHFAMQVSAVSCVHSSSPV